MVQVQLAGIAHGGLLGVQSVGQDVADGSHRRTSSGSLGPADGPSIRWRVAVPHPPLAVIPDANHVLENRYPWL